MMMPLLQMSAAFNFTAADHRQAAASAFSTVMANALTPGGNADNASRTVVVDPNPMNEIMKRAEQLRSETADGIIYPCEYCQKVFKFKYEYERHAKIHSGDRPWECPECMKTFSRKDNMRAHMKIHTGELVRHVCQLCGKSYGRKYDLQVHERVHTGERPFECGSCGKSFISTSRLRAHQLIHCKNIYLPRHVRNKRLHLLKTGRLLDSPTDSMDGGSPRDDLEDYDEEEDEELELQRQQIARETASVRRRTQKAAADAAAAAAAAAAVATAAAAAASAALKAPTKTTKAAAATETSAVTVKRPTINLTLNPVRHISISLVESTVCAPRDEVDGRGADGEDCWAEDSPDSASFVNVEEKMQQLEAALMQRKAELEERGIKVETDSLLDVNSDLRHEDFHVVLPTDACKDEPY